MRHFFYAMGKNEKFMTYAEVAKKLETLIPSDNK